MNARDRENATLSFIKCVDMGSVEETFFPWSLTVSRYEKEGIPTEITRKILDSSTDCKEEEDDLEKYFNVRWSEGVLEYEKLLGFDPVKRIGFTLPFRRFDEKVKEQAVSCEADWNRLKVHGDKELKKYFTLENMQKVYGPLKSGHDRGDYPIRMNIEGFFWTPRELLGIEGHMFAFYDTPELIHNMNEYILKVYLEKLTLVLDILPVDVLYIMEDLSGKTGPMISPDMFDEFIGSYYKRLIPVLKQKGVKHVFVDTDGDFRKLIPNFIDAGVDGFLPMDVNAGMDIVAVRKVYPNLKFIGAFNKLEIANGKEAIDREFERLMPVIKQGGYIPGADHQVAPSTALEDYKYYISKLKEVMKEAGSDL